MNHNTEVKYTTLEDFVMTVNDLGVELVIEEALRNARKAKLKLLIDERSSIKTRTILFNILTNLNNWAFLSE